MASSDKTVQKSHIRHVLEIAYPTCFINGDKRTPAEIGNVRLVFEDSMQTLKSFGDTWNSNQQVPSNQSCSIDYGLILLRKLGNLVLTHFEHLLLSFRQSAEITFRNMPNVEVYALMFDKYDFVPISKGHEQTKRNSSKAANIEDAEGKVIVTIGPADGISYKQRRPYLALGKEIPEDINKAKHDRDDTLPHIVRCICRELLNPLEGRRLSDEDAEPPKPWEPQTLLPQENFTTSFTIPHGKRVVIDGHCLQLEDLRNIQAIFPNRQMALEAWQVTLGKFKYEELAEQTLWDAAGFKSDRDVYSTPVVVESIVGPEKQEMRIAYMCRALANEQGEGDFCFFGMHHLLSRMLHREKNPDAVMDFPLLSYDVLSIDTDIGLLAGFNFDRWRRLGRYDAMQMDWQCWYTL